MDRSPGRLSLVWVPGPPSSHPSQQPSSLEHCASKILRILHSFSRHFSPHTPRQRSPLFCASIIPVLSGPWLFHWASIVAQLSAGVNAELARWRPRIDQTTTMLWRNEPRRWPHANVAGSMLPCNYEFLTTHSKKGPTQRPPALARAIFCAEYDPEHSLPNVS